MAIGAKFGQRVRGLRTDRNLTQEQLALEADLTLVYVNEIENGKRNVSIETASKLSQALGITLSELVQGIDGVC